MGPSGKIVELGTLHQQGHLARLQLSVCARFGLGPALPAEVLAPLSPGSSSVEPLGGGLSG